MTKSRFSEKFYDVAFFKSLYLYYKNNFFVVMKYD